jgi:TPR repeat protein
VQTERQPKQLRTSASVSSDKQRKIFESQIKKEKYEMTDYMAFPTVLQNASTSMDKEWKLCLARSSLEGFWARMPWICLLVLALTTGLLVQAAWAAGENNQPTDGSLEQNRKLADEGNAEAQYKLGRMYEEGLGLPQDSKEAAKWYLKAAEKGNAQAQYKMGTLYTLGKGVPKDRLEAAKWLGKAAQQGYEPVKQQIQETGTKLKDQLMKDPLGMLQRKFGG